MTAPNPQCSDGNEDLPESYRSNSKKERLLLSYAENFQRQFRQLYGDRKTLFLRPLNECAVEVSSWSTQYVQDIDPYNVRAEAVLSTLTFLCLHFNLQMIIADMTLLSLCSEICLHYTAAHPTPI